MKLPVALPALAAGLAALVWSPDLSGQSADDFFESRVRPVLAQKCADCHSERRRRGGLRVTSLDDLLRGGRSGPAIVPGDPDASLLIQVVRHEVEDLEMPQDADPLSAREIEGLVEWIRMDAPWPEAAAEIVLAANTASEGLSPGAQIFVDRVRPVLEQKCFSCHTDDERGGLRLDSRDRVLAGGGRGPAVLPGNPEQSLLVAAIRHESDDLQMPRNGDPLSEAEIEGIVAWIRAGAEWADVAAPLAIPRRGVTPEERSHWSFQPLAHPDVPSSSSEWAETDIDRFVLAALQRQGLTPVGPADKGTLIRRATYDLIGLPPTPEEIDAFLADDSPGAFETVVDRLLASDHYGERWGRNWLDVTRYGEDDTRGLAPGGSGRERYPMAYVHRDWVVDAFNDDMPYDDFVMAHLAADLMPAEERDEMLPALGFLGQGPWYYDIADPVIARADERHDRVDVTTRGFMGITVGCARCHDHKYDPIGIHDYYAVAGIFDNANYYEYPVADSATAAEFKAEQDFIKSMKEGLDSYLSTESDQLATVLSLQTSRYMMAAWKVTGKEQLPVEAAAAQDRLDLEVLRRWIRFLAKEPKHYPYVVTWQEIIADGGGTEERAQELADEFQRRVLEIVAERDKLEEYNQKLIARGTSLEETKSTPMPNGFESFFDEHQLELKTMDREKLNLLADLFFRDLDNELDTFFPQPGVFRFRGWGLERQLSRVAVDHVETMREEIEELEEELPDLPFVMGVEEKEEADIEDIGLHIRGDPRTLGQRVPRGFPHVLQGETPERYSEGSGRLELARDIASHPITARVIVNRVWAWHMGEGIVRTPSNFGFAGEPPTNPELLEYLAADFVENGHSIKRLHKQIMLSSVYQLAADDNPQYASVDPENRLFWRFNRQRLTAEAIRDGLLAVSGELDRKVGGKSIQLDDEDNDRRTLYSEVSRFQLHEYLQTFDFPNPSLTAEKRYATNVPLQSLYFMNSDFVHRQADAFVRRLAKATDDEATDGGEGADGSSSAGRGSDTPGASRASAARGGGDDDEEDAEPPPPARFDHRAMIEAAYPLLYGRDVTEAEATLGLEFIETQRAEHLKDELAKVVAEDDAEEADEAAESPNAAAGDSDGEAGGATGNAATAGSSADTDPADGGSATEQALHALSPSAGRPTGHGSSTHGRSSAPPNTASSADLIRRDARRDTTTPRQTWPTGHGHDDHHHHHGCGFVGGPPQTRRQALKTMGAGFGMMAFAQMIGASMAEAASPIRSAMGSWIPKPHFAPKAKNVIFLFMNGGVSQVDTFDPKPELDRFHGQPIPTGEIKTERKTGALMKSPFEFTRYGESGIAVSELFPHVGSVADDICVINSMHTDIPNHEPSLLMMNTGHIQPGRPSLGSWLTYGLGSENQNLPGFVVLCPDQPTVVGPPLWSNGFLPAIHQGTFIADKIPRLEDDFDPYALIPNIHTDAVDLDDQRREVDLVEQLNRLHLERLEQKDEEIEGAIDAMETAYRMQTEAPDVFDIRKETEATQKLYGPGSTARGCLMAVRLVEQGVRMVQVYYAKGDPWDHHGDIMNHRVNARHSDQAFAAVVKDLKSRGLFDETLVVCGTEFGRTPVLETGGGAAGGRVTNGRDHNPFGFSIWLAGGGVKGGMTYGRTDDFGFKAVENPVHIHDLHATILHLMGIDHTQLTYSYSGRDFRLTDVAGEVIHDIIA